MESIVDRKEIRELQLLNNFRQAVFQLERYDLETDEGGGWMYENVSGEYVKFEDVLDLFSAQKE